MSYFAAALVFLLAGLALMAGGFGFPANAVEAPDTLVVVHLIAVGWLCLLFCGALLQFVPVLTASEARLGRLAAPALLSIVGGLAMLVAGFLAMGGHVGVPSSIMLPGAFLLMAGLGVLALSFVLTILGETRPGLSSILVTFGLAGLTATALLGTGFAAALSGLFDSAFLDGLLPAAIPFHGAFGLLGWMTVTAIGVSYRLFSMFVLAPEATASARRVALSASAALLGGLAALSAALFSGGGVAWAVSLLAVALACLLACLYLSDIAAMFRARRRRQLELNSQAGVVALAFLAAGLIALAAGQFLETAWPVTPAAFYLLAMGWLTGLGLAQLYKIIPFLTWLEGYGPVMGKTAVPRVQDLVSERVARKWFVLYFASVALASALMLAGMPTGFRIAAVLQFIAVAGLGLEYVRARRLSYAPEALRLPAGARRPHLIYAAYG